MSWSEDQRLAILIDGGIGITFTYKELRGGMVRSPILGDGYGRPGAGFRIEARQIGIVDGVPMNGQSATSSNPANGLNRRRRNWRLRVVADAGA